LAICRKFRHFATAVRRAVDARGVRCGSV